MFFTMKGIEQTPWEGGGQADAGASRLRKGGECRVNKHERRRKKEGPNSEDRGEPHSKAALQVKRGLLHLRLS